MENFNSSDFILQLSAGPSDQTRCLEAFSNKNNLYICRFQVEKNKRCLAVKLRCGFTTLVLSISFFTFLSRLVKILLSICQESIIKVFTESRQKFSDKQLDYIIELNLSSNQI